MEVFLLKNIESTQKFEVQKLQKKGIFVEILVSNRPIFVLRSVDFRDR